MQVVFRADASLDIGSGHVMRCLTLADALSARGAVCTFLCRNHTGHLAGLITARGHAVRLLDTSVLTPESVPEPPVHARWLACTQEQDAEQCIGALDGLRPDWLVSDHYALDARWEARLRPLCGRILAIDDLADRAHDCDLLLDQNLGRSAADYAGRIPSSAAALTGPAHALLAPAFASERDRISHDRDRNSLHSILISMGGVDLPDTTSRILQALKNCPLPADCTLTVIMGAMAPWKDKVQDLARTMPWQTDVVSNVTDMASRMARSDLAIGAAGGTAWERCCVGLPTLLLILADNQRNGALALREQGAAHLIEHLDALHDDVIEGIRHLMQPGALAGMSRAASRLTDGRGTERVVGRMIA